MSLNILLVLALSRTLINAETILPQPDHIKKAPEISVSPREFVLRHLCGLLSVPTYRKKK